MFTIIISLYSIITSVIFDMLYKAQPSPFIDEIFHIPQVQKYCSGNFSEWDSKITTLPGLYIASVAMLSPLLSIYGINSCSLWSLRFLNIVFNSLSLFIIYNIAKTLNTQTLKTKDVQEIEDPEVFPKLTALVIGIFPLLYFYSFLYYTEPSSTFIVLAAYLACIRNYHIVAALLGLLSIVFRQSNVVWVFFMAGVIVARLLENISEIKKVAASPDLKDKLARFAAQLIASLIRYLLVIQNLLDIIALTWPYILVIACFSVFVYINNGITVGDRSSHQAVLHFPQLLYFSGFTLFFASPVLITVDKLLRFWYALKKKWIIFTALFIICIYVLLKYSHEHPYLLSDNRHYVFYLWKKILGKNFLRMCLIPFYLYSAWSMNDSLRVNLNCTLLWRLMFLLCVAVAVVPQKLLEFRYFILPFIFFRLHVKEQAFRTILLELLLHSSVNAITIYIFVTKTFKWQDSDAVQRIIW